MSMSLYPQLTLNDWTGVTPVILPIGPQTLSCIGIASAGVAVPFSLFLVALFYLLIPIWLQNFHNDKCSNSSGCSEQSVNVLMTHGPPQHIMTIRNGQIVNGDDEGGGGQYEVNIPALPTLLTGTLPQSSSYPPSRSTPFPRFFGGGGGARNSNMF